MERSSTLIIIFISVFLNGYILHSQDASWLTDVTSEVGLDSAFGTKILLVDVNNDNYPDLLWGEGNLIKNRYYLYLNVPNPDPNSPYKRIFVDFTEESGINVNRNPESNGRIADLAAMADVNNDGYLDLVTSIYYHRLQMYQNESDPGDRTEVLLNDGTGRFKLVGNSGLNKIKLVDTLPEGLINATGIAFLDYDYDGKIDIYISTWFSDYAANLANNGIGHKMQDALLKGNGDGTFQLITDSGIEKVAEPMYGVNVTDWDNDGWQDIITSPYCRSGGSLFKNMKNGKFTDVSFEAGYSAQKMLGDNGQHLCQWEAQPADFDNDGDMDLLQVLVHGGNNDNEGRTVISVNQGPDKGYTFNWEIGRLKRDAPQTPTHFGDMGGTWFDLDGDTKLDVAVACMGYINSENNINTQGQVRLYILKQNDSAYFDDISKALGIYETMKECHSMEPCDFDLDGDMDLFVSQMVYDTINVNPLEIVGRMKIKLLRNDIGNKNNWLSIKLDPPPGCNKSGIGARITVYSDTIAQIRELQAGIGHFSGQQHFTNTFGLLKRQVDSVVVRWPHKDLITTTVKNPEINTIIEIDGTGKKSIIKPYGDKAPLIAFENPFMKFASTDVGKSDTIEFKIINSGDADLNISSISYVDNPDGVFEPVKAWEALKLKPGDSKSIPVRFTPLARKTYYAKLIVSSDAKNEKESHLYLKGYGFEPKPLIKLSLSEINFPSAWKGQSSEIDVLVENIGELTLNITSVTFRNDNDDVFSVESFPSRIDGGENGNLKLVFSPLTIKKYTAELIINSDAYLSEEIILEVIGICDGPLPKITLDKPSLFFLNVDIGTDKILDFEIINEGNSDLIISEMKIEEDIDGVYEIIHSGLPLNINPGSSVSVSVKFSPKQEVRYNYDLLIESNDPANSQVLLGLRGTGRAPSSVMGDELNQFIGIEAMPVPATDVLDIVIKNSSGKELLAAIKIISLYGNTELRMEQFYIAVGDSKQRIDLKGLSSGLYLLIFELSSGTITLPVSIIR